MRNVEQTQIDVSFAEDGSPLTEIKNKAFLSQKSVYKLSVGESVNKIGDWAFAHMENLELLILPPHELTWGKQVFLGCRKLEQIQIRGDESGNPATPWLLASAVRILKDDSLLCPELAGSSVHHEEWMKKYDEKLVHFIEAPDEEGFDPVFIGWFNVEDVDDQLPRHLKKRREEKAELILQRLLYPDCLEEKSKNVLVGYLKEHMPGEEKREHIEAFHVICREDDKYEQDVRYMQLLEREGMLQECMIDALLDSMKNPSAEVKAYLLNKKAEMTCEKDVFEAFEL